MASTSPVISLFLHFLAWAFAAKQNELIWQFQLTVDIFALMAAQSSDLDDQKSGATIQAEDHTLTPPNGQIGQEEMEASGSPLLHSPTQYLVRRQMPDTLRLGIVWKFKLPQPKMEELHHHLQMPGMQQWWKACFKMANLALQKQL